MNTELKEFINVSQVLIEKYKNKYKKDFKKNKSYKDVAFDILTKWLKDYTRSLFLLEILEELTENLKVDDQKLKEYSDNDKQNMHVVLNELDKISLCSDITLCLIRDLVNSLK